MALVEGLSGLDKAMNDTLVAKADGSQFDRLCAMYGLPRIPFIERKYWRRAVVAANMAKRDSLGAIFSLCREGLRKQDQVRGAKLVLPAGAGRYRLYRDGDNAGFTEEEQFRLWEINGKVFLSGIRGPLSGGVSEYIEMNRHAGPNWAGFDAKAFGVADGSPVQATLLPFHLRGAGGKAELVLQDDSTVPPTFLQEFFSATASVPVDPTAAVLSRGGIVSQDGTLKGITFGERREIQATYTGSVKFLTTSGFIAVNGLAPADPVPSSGAFSVNPATGGPASVYEYLSAAYSPVLKRWSLNSVRLVEGPGQVFSEGQLVRIHTVPARGGAYRMTLLVNGAPALTLTLPENSESISDQTTEIPVSAGDAVAFSVAADTGSLPSFPLVGATMSAFMARPAGQPLGGELMAEAIPDQPGSGPWPLYLEAGQAKDWQDTLARMVALGVEPVARISIHLNSD